MAQDSAESIQALFEEARQTHAAGKREEAEKAYRHILEIDPAHCGTLMMLASLEVQRGDFKDAFATLQRASEAEPENPAPWNLLAVTLASLNRLADAETACRQSLALSPQQPQMQGWLGGLLLRLHKPEAAVAAFRAALSTSPDSAEAHHGLASALRDMGDTAGAIASCRTAIGLQPQDAEPHALLVHLLIKAGDVEAAREAADQGLALHPDSEEMRFTRAAIAGEGVKTAPPAYVEAVFENHAHHYDTVLVQELQYRSPQFLLDAVKSVAAGRMFDILDLGCGTGLCGPLFKPLAKSLDGIDLSRAMILQARARGVYERLGISDLVGFLRKTAVGSYDLLLAADVFVYVGDLAETFAAAAAVLPAGGLLAFSVEAIEGMGFQLRPTMRFGHALSYVQELGAQHGLMQRYAEQRPLRNENGVPVMGWIVVLEKRV